MDTARAKSIPPVSVGPRIRGDDARASRPASVERNLGGLRDLPPLRDLLGDEGGEIGLGRELGARGFQRPARVRPAQLVALDQVLDALGALLVRS